MKNAKPKAELHPRNQHRGRYDFKALVKTTPGLAAFVAVNAHGDESIDFADAAAVKSLNQALLRHFYGVEHWDLPEGYLCPPIPGRADALHYLADLLASCNDGEIPCGESVRGLDVGVGANCIYPLIGQAEYGWRFVGSDIDSVALEAASRIVNANGRLSGAIELRLQRHAARVFEGVIRTEDEFDFTICNPPFYASKLEAEESARRKWRNLGKAGEGRNFSGHGSELWCQGGELGFIRRMIDESLDYSKQCFWFSTLVSKESHLPEIYRLLKKAQSTDFRTFEMAQGQKKSRLVAWTFARG